MGLFGRGTKSVNCMRGTLFVDLREKELVHWTLVSMGFFMMMSCHSYEFYSVSLYLILGIPFH